MGATGPRRFGKYQLISKLGIGGMAEAWRAELVAGAGVRKPVVIKRILPHRVAQEGFVEMFIAEARLTAGLSHSNIAQVFDFGEQDGEYFLALELVEGESLRELCDRARAAGDWHLPLPVAVLIAIELCKGLHYAHTRVDARGRPLKIVHRDVSPDNVMLSYDGEVKLVDFGVAKAALAGRDQTEPGMVKGKFLYLSPEQARGQAVDARSDVFAVGIVLYELLSGSMPFGDQPLQALRALGANRREPLARLNPALPERLIAVVDQALEVDLEQRTGSALALQEALSEMLFGVAGRASLAWVAQYMAMVDSRVSTGRGQSAGSRPEVQQQLEQWRPAPGPGEQAQPRPETSKARDSSSRPAEKRELATGNPKQAVAPRPARPSALSGAPPWLWWGLGAAGLGALALVVWVELRPAPGPPPALPAEVTTPQPLGPPPVTSAPLPEKSPQPLPSLPHNDGYDGADYDAPEAPVRFVLDSHHRFTVEDSPTLGPSKMAFEVTAWPWVREWNEFRPHLPYRASAQELRRIELAQKFKERAVFLFTRTPTGLSVRAVKQRDTWPGGNSWVLVLFERDANGKLQLDPMQLKAHGVPLQLANGVRALDALDRFEVKSLLGRKEWTLTLTAREGSGKSLVSPILCALPAGPDSPPAQLDGSPLERNMAVVAPGKHRLAGAGTLWMSIPSYTGLDTVAFDVELAP